MPKQLDSVDLFAGEVRETLPVFSEDDEFIPVVKFQRDIRFLKNTATVKISTFANGDILVQLLGTDITAEGSSIEEAVDALKLEIEEEYYFLKEIKRRLSNHLKEQFDIIKKFF